MPNDFRKTAIKPLYKKGDKNKNGDCKGMSLVSISSKLLSMMTIF